MWQHTASSILGFHIWQSVDLAVGFLHGAVEGRTANELHGSQKKWADTVVARQTFDTAQACDNCQLHNPIKP